jgi:hypothetical protein
VANVLGLVPASRRRPRHSTSRSRWDTSRSAYHAYGVKAQGLGSYLKHFLGPVLFIAPLMLVIEIFSHTFGRSRSASVSAEHVRRPHRSRSSRA